jgi:hypothetical protein
MQGVCLSKTGGSIAEVLWRGEKRNMC